MDRVSAGYHGIPMSVAAGDLQGDGTVEMAVGSRVGNLHVKALGGEAWELSMGSQVTDVAVADLTGDGALNVLACSASHYVVCADADGGVVWRANVGGAARQMAVGDLNGDGAAEIVVAVADSAPPCSARAVSRSEPRPGGCGADRAGGHGRRRAGGAGVWRKRRGRGVAVRRPHLGLSWRLQTTQSLAGRGGRTTESGRKDGNNGGVSTSQEHSQTWRNRPRWPGAVLARAQTNTRRPSSSRSPIRTPGRSTACAGSTGSHRLLHRPR